MQNEEINEMTKLMVQNIAKLSSNINKYVMSSEKAVIEMRQNTQTIKESISRYIRNEADLIEQEMNQYIRYYLQNYKRFENYNIFCINNSWKNLYIQYIDKDKPDEYINKKQITEFDGIYILTTDTSYEPDIDADWICKRIRKNNVKNSKKNETFFLVLEAKHSITNNDINQKLQKLVLFQDYIRFAKQENFENVTKEFIRKKTKFKLDLFEIKLIVVFGSNNMNENQENKIKNIGKSFNENHDITISYMKPCGERYEIYDYDNHYNKNNMVYGNIKSNSIDAKQVKIGSGKIVR